MLRWLLFALGLSTMAQLACAQWPTAVAGWHFGTSQTHGQAPEYFPANVLGPLTPPFTPTAPAVDPHQVVSLGKGGWIALEFDPPIPNGPGVDFIVFENPIMVPANGYIFDEWMTVSVSLDGTTWHTFAYDSLTGEGMAGRTPTAAFGTNLQDPALAGGDGFDLDELGLAQVRYVRVDDATRFQTPDRLSAELDGIVAVHVPVTGQPHTWASPKPRLWRVAGQFYATGLPTEPAHWHCTDATGRLVAQGMLRPQGPSTPLPVVLPTLAPGLYYLTLAQGTQPLSLKWVQE